METTAVIQTRGLSKVYLGQVAVQPLDLDIAEGEIFGFLGPNGAGKTTTILMLLGLTEPSAGTVRVLGLDPCRNPIVVKRQVGYLQENMGFYGDMTGWQMLAYIADLNGINPKAAYGPMVEAFRDVGLSGEEDKKIAAYSRGMRQRLGIAEILLKQPRIAILDEPTLGLDPDATNRIMDLIGKICTARKMTVLLSSHQLHQAQKICTRVGIMIKGKMVACGPMAELAREKLGIGQEHYSLEEIYMKYFTEV
jgi:ABC-2 type transport system ATP-binding protein